MKSPIQIRPYAPQDFDACDAIFSSNCPLYFQEHERPGFHKFLQEMTTEDYWAVELSGKVIGCGGIAVRPTGQGDLCFGLIHQDLHRRGYGSVFTRYRLNKLIERPAVKFIALHTSQHTVGFYEKLGFKLLSTTENAYGPGLHRKDMQLAVSEKVSDRTLFAV